MKVNTLNKWRKLNFYLFLANLQNLMVKDLGMRPVFMSISRVELSIEIFKSHFDARELFYLAFSFGVKTTNQKLEKKKDVLGIFSVGPTR